MADRSADSKVGLAPEGTGPAVRTIKVTTFIDGVETEVEMQVIAASEADGTPLSFSWQADLLAQVVGLRGDIRMALAAFDIELDDEELKERA